MTDHAQPEGLPEIVTFLRALVSKPCERPSVAEVAAIIPRLFPTTVEKLDTAGLAGWCIVGLWLFSDRPTRAKRVRAETRRLVLALEMLRTNGNITRVAQCLGTSRRAVRDQMRRLGLYPWLPSPNEDPCDGPGGDAA